MKKLYLFFKDEITCLFTPQIFRFFCKKLFFFNFRRKSEEKSYQIENYFKKYENLTMCVY